VRLVALEAALQVRLFVDLLVGTEHLVFPLAVADVVAVFGAPALALFHHRVGDEVALLETAVRILDGVALCVDDRLVLDQGQHGAARDRLPLAHRIDRFLARIELAVLLDVVTIEHRIQGALFEAFRKRDLSRRRR
jgi:hypothetical protein